MKLDLRASSVLMASGVRVFQHLRRQLRLARTCYKVEVGVCSRDPGSSGRPMRQRRTGRRGISNSSKEWKSEITNKGSIYQLLNELSMHQIVHDSVTPSLTMVRHKLTPRGVVAFDPFLQGGVIHALCSRWEEDHILWPCMRSSAGVNR